MSVPCTICSTLLDAGVLHYSSDQFMGHNLD